MRQILVLKRKAREAYLALFYDKCELLTEMIAAAVIIKAYRRLYCIETGRPPRALPRMLLLY